MSGYKGQEWADVSKVIGARKFGLKVVKKPENALKTRSERLGKEHNRERG